MSNDLVKQQEAGNIAVTATIPEEMQCAQDALIVWCRKKVALMKEERDDALACYSEAVKHKWKASPYKRHADGFEKRVVFYDKMLAALQAGYMIVPNMPVALFAVRTGRKKPPKSWMYFKWQSDVPDVPGQPMVAGECTWVSPDPIVESERFKDEKGADVEKWRAREISPEIDFPLAMAKPCIMEATGRAMAIKVFDQMGMVPANTGDPMILAQMIDPRSTRWNRRVVSFLIAWHLNTRDL